MYKLLLVDDEEEVRKGILQKIEWETYGFEIAGEAENGKDALEIAERTIPDIVITDIKMPFMDGLTLSELLKEKISTVRIIILTGFDEFEYAQKAVRLNLAEYVLKPVSSIELLDVLIKVKKQIDDEVAQKRDLQILKEYYVKNLPVLREKFLSVLVSSIMNQNEIQEKMDSYKLDLNGTGFIVSLISIDYHKMGINGWNYRKTDSTGPCSDCPEDKELLKYAVLNIADEIAVKYKSGIVFMNNDYIVLLSVSGENDRETIMKTTMLSLEEIRQSIEKYLDFTVTIGIGSFCSEIANVRQSYKDAVTAMDYRVVIGNNRIICIDDVEPQNSNKVLFNELKEHSLVTSIKVGTEKEIKEAIESLFDEIIGLKASFIDYQLYMLEILTIILKTARDLDINISNVFARDCDLFVELRNFTDIQAAKAWIIGICIKISGYISRDRQNTYYQLVQNARDFISKHFCERDLTIDRVCKHLHISATYFSTIFKKETKVTFTNYLMQLKMDAAKELLRSTDLKSFEISDRIGFSEPNYFSYCFKKNFNVSPTEYRNSLKLNLNKEIQP